MVVAADEVQACPEKNTGTLRIKLHGFAMQLFGAFHRDTFLHHFIAGVSQSIAKGAQHRESHGVVTISGDECIGPLPDMLTIFCRPHEKRHEMHKTAGIIRVSHEGRFKRENLFPDTFKFVLARRFGKCFRALSKLFDFFGQRRLDGITVFGCCPGVAGSTGDVTGHRRVTGLIGGLSIAGNFMPVGTCAPGGFGRGAVGGDQQGDGRWRICIQQNLQAAERQIVMRHASSLFQLLRKPLGL